MVKGTQFLERLGKDMGVEGKYLPDIPGNGSLPVRNEANWLSNCLMHAKEANNSHSSRRVSPLTTFEMANLRITDWKRVFAGVIISLEPTKGLLYA
jgi:hypothetical protein